MPRAVDPKLGDDGYEQDIGADLALTPESVELLMALLDPEQSIDAEELAHILSALGMDYRRRAKRGAGAFSRAQARAALDTVLKLPAVTCHAVVSLNERALAAVHDQLVQIKGIWEPGDSPFEMLYCGELSSDVLRAACSGARDLMINTKGPEPEAALHICIDELCGLYEKLTGMQITLSNKVEDRRHSSAPCSMGGRFVLEAARLLIGEWHAPHKNRLPSAVSGCIRGWIGNRALREHVHTSRTCHVANPITGCLLNEGDGTCNNDKERPWLTRTSSTEVANDNQHSRPQGREYRDRVAETRSAKRPDA